MACRSSRSRRTTFGALRGRRRLPDSPRLDPRTATTRRARHRRPGPPAAAARAGAAPARRRSAPARAAAPARPRPPIRGSRVCAAFSPCACVRATSTTRAGGTPDGAQRPACSAAREPENNSSSVRLPRPAVRAQPPHRRPARSAASVAPRQPLLAAPAGPRPPAPQPQPSRIRSKPPSADRRIATRGRRLPFIVVINVNQCH